MPSYNIEAVTVSYSEEQNDSYSPPSSNDTTAYSAVATLSSGSPTRNNSNTTAVIPTTSHASTHCSGHGVTSSAPYSYYPYPASHYHGSYGRYYHPHPYSSSTLRYPGHDVPSNETTSATTTRSTAQPVPSVEREDPYRPLSHHVVAPHEGYYYNERSCPSSYHHPTGGVASTTAPSNHHYNSTSTSTSTPARSNKLDWVDDNNSPRGVMDYHQHDAYSNPYESSPNHGPGYDSYRYDNTHASVHRGQEQYPVYNQSMSSWEQQQPPPTQYYNPPAAARLPPPSDDRNNAKHQFRKEARDRNSEPIILKKSFSWRNYPELEQYLIANRTKYLQHSAKNYTVEQKQFNNRLTDGLLQVAADYNYIFDESCFDFVSVRDRIRCYYKSYVQSLKKRGVVRTLDNGKIMPKRSRC
eukprot:scaffold50014_cov66-Cyclotella_meneghiniana.AAC.9